MGEGFVDCSLQAVPGFPIRAGGTPSTVWHMASYMALIELNTHVQDHAKRQRDRTPCNAVLLLRSAVLYLHALPCGQTAPGTSWVVRPLPECCMAHQEGMLAQAAEPCVLSPPPQPPLFESTAYASQLVSVAAQLLAPMAAVVANTLEAPNLCYQAAKLAEPQSCRMGQTRAQTP